MRVAVLPIKRLRFLRLTEAHVSQPGRVVYAHLVCCVLSPSYERSHRYASEINENIPDYIATTAGWRP
jgi:hypothetical protein